jgi:hypothetical protein
MRFTLLGRVSHYKFCQNYVVNSILFLYYNIRTLIRQSKGDYMKFKNDSEWVNGVILEKYKFFVLVQLEHYKACYLNADKGRTWKDEVQRVRG